MLQTVDEQVLKVICENLKPVMHTEDIHIIREREPLDKMPFITQGTVWDYTSSKSSGSPSSTCCLGKNDFHGEELLDRASKFSSFSDLPISTRTVKSHTKVEAFALMAKRPEELSLSFGGISTRRCETLKRCYWQQLPFKRLGVVTKQRGGQL